MPNELFSTLAPVQQQQGPREQCMSLLRQHGFSVPSGMENNPQGILQMVMQSGRIPQGRLGMAQQIMQRMFRR